MNIERNPLPGIGISYAFTTAHGQRLGVIAYLNGRRDLVLYDQEDPQQVSVDVVLDPLEAARVAELFTESITIDHIIDIEQQPTGVAVARLPIPAGSPLDGHALRDTPDDAKVVAVIRDNQIIAAPESGFVLRHGDTLVVVGEYEAVRAVGRAVTRGSPAT